MKKKASLHNKALELLLAEEFKKYRLDKVRFDFAGSGDSGSIDGHSFEPDAGDKDESVEAEREALVIKFKLEDMAYAALERTGIDYVNNDGGQGHLTISPKGIEVLMEENHMTSTEHEFSFTLEEVKDEQERTQ